MDVVDASFGYPLEIEEKASIPLAVGIVNKISAVCFGAQSWPPEPRRVVSILMTGFCLSALPLAVFPALKLD